MKLVIWPTYAIKRDHICLRLNPQQGIVMLMLLDRREVRLGDFVESLWPDPRWQPDNWRKCLYNLIRTLRLKLERLGATIRVRKNFGWSFAEVET